MWSMGLSRYWLGAPLTRRGRDSYKNQLIERFVEEYVLLHGLPEEVIDNPKAGGNLVGKRLQAEAFAYDRACALVDRTLERVTDKSIGLLQVMALIATVLTLTSTASKTNAMTGPNFWAFVVLAGISLILLTNMFIAWYSNPQTYRQRLKNIDRLLSLAAWRSIRLTLALYLTVVLMALTGWGMITSFPPPAMQGPVEWAIAAMRWVWQFIAHLVQTL